MGILPWIIGILLLISCTAWFHLQQLSESFFTVSVDCSSLSTLFAAKFDPVSERSQLIYEAKSKRKEDNEQNANPESSKNTSRHSIRQSNRTLDEEIVPDESSLSRQHGNTVKQLALRLPYLKLTRRLHLTELFSHHGDSPKKDLEKKILLRLMKINYASLSSSPLLGNSRIPTDAFYDTLVETLLAEATRLYDKITIREPERLANFQLNDEQMTYTLFRILRGGELSSPLLACQLPALTKLISFQHRSTLLSLYLAPYPLLLAVCENEKAARLVVKERKEIYAKLRKLGRKRPTAEDRTTLQEEFKTRVSPYIAKDIDLQYIDFSVSYTNPGS